ncbi:putative GMC oxidoreductase [Triangularia verruculosa]|uniref:GMC oxidoreductase n=1 Tax=Triangularia verruculosa TaxID=2587418 RepID=A0AAN7AVW3_9PEZI|nr:putative GMC oxidoreductase [Triangularia verruculosa]
MGTTVDARKFAETKFDYIVVGGGTAGLTVASRLAEVSSLTIGVLEAGTSGYGDHNIDIPAYSGRALGGPYDWHFQTTPQPGLGGRTLPWNRGRVLGGSSALNYMTWNRGSKEDYDAWEELGNAGWGWDSLLPYFKKSERFHPPPPEFRDNHQASYNEPNTSLGNDGPINVSYTRDFSPSHALWHATFNELGVESNPAHLDGSNVGVWTTIVAVNPETATRSYATHYCLTPPKNLHILTDAMVEEIILEKDDGEWAATGVRFSRYGDTYDVSASREVILSAGSVQSPQLLELSGIGRVDILGVAGIPVKVESPKVGENLQEHIMLPMVFEVDPSLPHPDDLFVDEIAATAYEQYQRGKSGRLTVLPCSMCYLPVSRLAPADDVASLLSKSRELERFGPEEASILSRRFNADKQLGQVEFVFDLGNWNPSSSSDEEGKRHCSMLLVLQYPFSRGSIHIGPDAGPRAESPPTVYDQPLIDPKYYGGPHGELDLQIMLHGARFAQKICSTKPLKNIIPGPVSPSLDVVTDDDLRSWIVENTITDWHPIGTCAMGGRAGREDGVVDERLRVYGVKRLRVIDASVMPLHISAHLQATVYAIGEKGADMILEDAGLRSQ